MSKRILLLFAAAVGVVCVGLLSGTIYKEHLSDGSVQIIEGDFSDHFSIGDPRFILYTLPGCSYCAEMEEFLSEHEIMFEVRDVSTNFEYQQRIVALGSTRVPFLVTANLIVEGFQRRTVERTLAEKGIL